ncbi:hypothetical protein IAR50_004871 [Cryptococcus sp. DSM 104548]
MSDPLKPRRKVASQISANSTPSSTPNRQPFKPTVRAKVAPGNIATPPSKDERPTLQRPPSASSLRSYVTAPPSVSRSRSPGPPAISPSTVSRISARPPQRSPLTAGVSHSSPTPGPSGSSTPTIARVKAKSVIGSSSSPSSAPSTPSSILARQTPEAQVRRNAADKAASAQMASSGGRTRTNSLRSAVSTSTSTSVGGDRAHVARVRPAKAASTPNAATLQIPASAPLPTPTRTAEPPAHIVSPAPALNGLGMDGTTFSPSPWPQPSPPQHSPQAFSLAPPLERSPTSGPSSVHRAIHIPHPTASAPTSPIPGSSLSSSRHLPDAPLSAQRPRGYSKSRLPAHGFSHTHHPPSLPLPPSSPELRPVALPVMTPGKGTPGTPGSEKGVGWERSEGEGTGVDGGDAEGGGVPAGLPWLGLGSGDGAGRDSLARAVRHLSLGPDGHPYENGHKIEGLPVSGYEQEQVGEERDDEVGDMLGVTAEQAKVNRKIADLEISNASLMAINKMLEATKSKQRAEIVKLRRRLRETLSHHPTHHPSLSHPALSPLSNSSFPPPQTSPTLSALTFEDDQLLDDYYDAEMADPQLDARWENVQGLVRDMQERAREAVGRDEGRVLGKEREGEGGGRVLGWAEVEARDGNGDGEGQAGDVSVDSFGTPVESIIDDLLGVKGEESGTDDERPPRRGSF